MVQNLCYVLQYSVHRTTIGEDSWCGRNGWREWNRVGGNGGVWYQEMAIATATHAGPRATLIDILEASGPLRN
jgi:hypothetical protein